MTKTPIICYFHGASLTGRATAWVISTALGHEAVHLKPAGFSTRPNFDEIEDKIVILAGTGFKRLMIESIAQRAKFVLVISHRQPEIDALADYPAAGPNFSEMSAQAAPGSIYLLADSDVSTAQNAWRFFFGAQPYPFSVFFTADYDLWRFKSEDTRNIIAWMESHAPSPEDFHDIEKHLRDNRKFRAARDEGEAILRAQSVLVDRIIASSTQTMRIGGHDVPAVNSAIFPSEIGNKLAQDAPFAAVYYDKPGKRVFSLRSHSEDVAEIAALYGGSGHSKAAGFRAPPGWAGDPEGAEAAPRHPMLNKLVDRFADAPWIDVAFKILDVTLRDDVGTFYTLPELALIAGVSPFSEFLLGAMTFMTGSDDAVFDATFYRAGENGERVFLSEAERRQVLEALRPDVGGAILKTTMMGYTRR